MIDHYQMAEEEEEDCDCPICTEPFDDTDKLFFPCKCGFQICLWCFDKVKASDGRCPACRAEYDEGNFTYVKPSEEYVFSIYTYVH